jgi:hypothetical protein
MGVPAAEPAEAGVAAAELTGVPRAAEAAGAGAEAAEALDCAERLELELPGTETEAEAEAADAGGLAEDATADAEGAAPTDPPDSTRG